MRQKPVIWKIHGRVSPQCWMLYHKGQIYRCVSWTDAMLKLATL
jgi:hypothetical protein